MRARVRKDAGQPMAAADTTPPWSVRVAATLPKHVRISNPLLGEDVRDAFAVIDTGMADAAIDEFVADADGALVVWDTPPEEHETEALGVDLFKIDGSDLTFGANYALPAAVWIDVIRKAAWTTKYINALPDSAFLHILPGGEKDGDGKTVPRSLRMFPVYDDSGALDLPHLRNALARIPQSTRVDQAVKDKLTSKAQKLLAEAEKSLDITQVLKADETEDERYILGVVLEPDTVDSQGDMISAEEIRQAAHGYMQSFGNVGLQHQVFVNDKIKILESFIAPVDFEIGGQLVKAGTWLMGFRVLDDSIWKAVKEGTLGGLSIGGTGRRVAMA